DVLSYLEDDPAAEAIKTLGKLARRALYFGALTVEDRDLCDPVRTDTDVYLRSNRWYRRRLGRHFEPVGGGLWLKKPVEAFIWTLDRRA
ncbi:MAG: methyltransferase type 11, partial [Gammaproteobacteria bacterium]|nr:methyltransferase type 11 [Gammaproteobacteria bacterium]